MTPIQILMDEHQQILAVLDTLEEGADRLDSGDKVDPEFFLDAAEFVAGFADRCHHAKEEGHPVRSDDGHEYAAGFGTGRRHAQ